MYALHLALETFLGDILFLGVLLYAFTCTLHTKWTKGKTQQKIRWGVITLP